MKTNLNAIYNHPGMALLHKQLAEADHRTLVLWALDTGREVLELFTRLHPEDPRPTTALEAAQAWSRGEIKMPAAKRAAKETHQAAKDILQGTGQTHGAATPEKGPPATDAAAAAAAAHAMGQIIGVIHVGTHAPAYASYAVQALILIHHDDDPQETLEKAAGRLSERLTYWETAPEGDRPWASFLLRNRGKEKSVDNEKNKDKG